MFICETSCGVTGVSELSPGGLFSMVVGSVINGVGDGGGDNDVILFAKTTGWAPVRRICLEKSKTYDALNFVTYKFHIDIYLAKFSRSGVET